MKVRVETEKERRKERKSNQEKDEGVDPESSPK